MSEITLTALVQPLSQIMQLLADTLKVSVDTVSANMIPFLRQYAWFHYYTQVLMKLGIAAAVMFGVLCFIYLLATSDIYSGNSTPFPKFCKMSLSIIGAVLLLAIVFTILPVIFTPELYAVTNLIAQLK